MQRLQLEEFLGVEVHVSNILQSQVPC